MPRSRSQTNLGAAGGGERLESKPNLSSSRGSDVQQGGTESLQVKASQSRSRRGSGSPFGGEDKRGKGSAKELAKIDHMV